MDALYPERPLVTWLHRMRDGAPTDILIDQLIDDKWRITAFSKHTQRFTMISLHYVNNPAQNFKPTVKILELFNFTLPLHRFEEIFNYTSRVNSVGCAIQTISSTQQDTTEGNVVLNIYRAFEDGSIQLNSIELAAATTENTDPIRPIEFKPPVTTLSSGYQQLLSNLKTHLMPVAGGRGPHMPEVIDVKTHKLKGFLTSIQSGNTPLTDSFKKEIAGKVEDLKSTITFRELFDDEEYEAYSLQDLNDFLDIMEIHEHIERGRQPDTFGIYHKGKPIDLALHEKLNRAHEKEMHLSSVTLRPLRESDSTFRYLDPNNIRFESTTTSKLLSSLWTIDSTRHDQLEFPHYTPDRLLKPEKFPSVNIYQRPLEEAQAADAGADISLSQPMPKIKTLSSESATVSLPLEEDVPVLVSTTTPKKRKKEETPSSFSAISTQPLPGVFGSRTKKSVKKKSKPKSSGFK
ncbi:hypothetical protein BD770DRAFT_45249 [Pilaira anomala]|nr:hypothetical protein BD770DRAFT_45249 [Pilaira anomala]